MDSVFQFVAPPSTCGYLPDQCWQLEYEIVRKITKEEYLGRLEHGWRRFGASLFRPRCPACSSCQSLRVDVKKFLPSRRLRRVRKANEGRITLSIGTPSVSRIKLDLYDRYHAFQSDFKDWPAHDPKDARGYTHSFVDNPVPTQEWCYYLDGRLVGAGYVDDLGLGMSAIYFFYDPDHRDLSLGTWNILCQLECAARIGIPYLYLGYYVEGCRSMEYKASFTPNQLLGKDQQWHDFRM